VSSDGPAASPHEPDPLDYGVLLTTTPTREEAARIANLLIDEKLGACVQLMPIESFYAWQGKTHNEAEVLLLVKTRTSLFEKAIARIKAVHSYTVPEIVALPFTAGFGGYLNWIGEVTAVTGSE
jgi:periplasmic divalent cation tolerance protein